MESLNLPIIHIFLLCYLLDLMEISDTIEYNRWCLLVVFAVNFSLVKASGVNVIWNGCNISCKLEGCLVWEGLSDCYAIVSQGRAGRLQAGQVRYCNS